MSDSELWLDVDGSLELTRASAALGKAEKDIGRQLVDIIWDGAVDVANEAARVVQTLPTHGRVHTGLRKRIARGIDVKRLPGGKVRIRTTMADPDEAIIPRGFDSPLKGFWHPVFGDQGERVTQRPNVPYKWFRDTVDDAQPIIERNLEDMLDDQAKGIRDATIL